MTLDEVIERLQEIRKSKPGNLEVFYLVHLDDVPYIVDKIEPTKADVTARDFGYKKGQPYILISCNVISS